jgi:hypothetical protein
MSQVLDRFWSIDDIVGDDVRDQLDGRTLFPTEFSTSVDENGASHLLLGMGDQGCNAGSEPVNVLVDFTPDTETSWSHLSGAPWSTAPVGWAPWSEGGAVQIESPWSEPRWHMVTPDGEQSGPAPGGVWNVRAGPMLDPEGPTFVVLGRDPAAPVGDSVFVIHDGDDVWSIDQLRFGLQLRDVTIMDIIVLPPWEGAE